MSRIVLVSLVGGLASACSSDTVRFSEPFANPFSSSQRLAASEPQGRPSAPAPAQVASVPTPSVQSQPLPPVQAAPVSRVATTPVPAAPVSRVAGAPVTSSQGGWSAAGGTRITVGANDTLDALSQRYGVPSSAILMANGLSSSNQVAAGRDIVIPVYNATGQSPRIAAPAAKPKFRLVEGPKPTVESPKPAAQKLAEKTEEPKQRVRPGMNVAKKERAAAQQVASATPAASPASKPHPAQVASRPEPQPAKIAQPAPRTEPQPAKVAQTAQRPEPQPAKVVAQAPAAKPAAPAPQVQPQPQVAAAPAPAPAAEPEQTGALNNDFRWPARGRVIAGFGANGGNEGINIALPEGTPVKATEAGTVTYAGSEVRGYGNLVLIRHDNGFVSAYAHNAALNVKRGERVKRGQVIATSGQTGNVTSPQLHFELRKGQAPVDPLPYLGGN